MNLIASHRAAYIGSFGVDGGSGVRDCNRFGLLTNLELNIDRIGLLGDYTHILQQLLLEAALFDFHRVPAGRESIEVIQSSRIGRGRADLIGFLIGQGYRRIRYYGTLRISHDSLNRGAILGVRQGG